MDCREGLLLFFFNCSCITSGYSLCCYVVRLLIMGRTICLDCAALHFNSLWLQCDMLKLLSMENPNFEERLKRATLVN